MNHMRDASFDWGKSLIKIVDDIRQAFSDAFYSIGEMLINHTGSWKQTFRKFYQDIGGSVGKTMTNYMGTAVTSLFTPETKDKEGKVTPGGLLGSVGALATNPYVAAAVIAASIAIATSPSARHAEEMKRWNEKKEVNRQVELEKAKIWAVEYAREMEKADLTLKSVSGGLGTSPLKQEQSPEYLSNALRESRAWMMRSDALAAAHAQYKHSKSQSALRYYEDLLDNPIQWWIDQV
jgi:hypothetical protein